MNTVANVRIPMIESQIANPTEGGIIYRDEPISFRTRFIIRLMRFLIKPMLSRMATADTARLAKAQLRVASTPWPAIQGAPIRYDVVGNVPGHIIGDLKQTSKPLILWLHGGAFFLPAAPSAHLQMVAQLCAKLGASGFIPDYRLAPSNPFPRGLDDCEASYLALLDMGHQPESIVLGGDSAGGNLVFGVLQRIRRAKLPLPACVIPVSPVTEMSRVHSPTSRHQLARKDPLLPLAALAGIATMYCGSHDSVNPELSPLYMDCKHLPPLFFIASNDEILRDDTVLLAQSCLSAGVDTTCHLWPELPHAFPLFSALFPEAKRACEDIENFARQHLKLN